MRRRHQHHPFTGLGQARQSGPQQAQLATADGGQENLAERRGRPATG
nr:hypothetical protein [Tanacetum cinerariifolium]